MSWSYNKTCEEPGCKNLATHSIRIALRSRPVIIAETSDPVGFVCDDHKEQSFNEVVPQAAWDSLVLTFFKVGKMPPVRTVSYLVIKPWQPYKNEGNNNLRIV